MACTKDHTGDLPAAVSKLPDSQAGTWRHRCAGCAYLLGLAHASEAEGRLRERVRELQGRVRELEAEKK